MRVLIIGGTSFLGRATAEDSLRRGAEVTTFNRGRTAPDVAGVEALRGDRESADDLAQLAGRRFDVVVDTCGFVPGVVGRSAAVLAGSGAQYVFVSSISATTTWPAAPTPDGGPVRSAALTPARTPATTAGSKPAASGPSRRSSVTEPPSSARA